MDYRTFSQSRGLVAGSRVSGFAVLLVFSIVGAPAARPGSAQVQPVLYAVGHDVIRISEEPDESVQVRTFLGQVRAVSANSRGDLIAIDRFGDVVRIEAQTGRYELLERTYFGLSHVVDAAFDAQDNFWLLIPPGNGETRLYRFGPDFGDPVAVGAFPLLVDGITFRGDEMIILAERSLYTVDLESLTPELLVGPFPDDGIFFETASVVGYKGLAVDDGGRFFTIFHETFILAPPDHRAAVVELQPDTVTLRLLADFADGVGPAIRPEGCTPSDTTICLRNGRFAVHVDWEQPGAGTRTGRKTRFITRDSGVFSFVGTANLEVTAKVLDACGLDGYFWVFSASATSLEHSITVRDTFSSEVRTYRQPGGGSRPVTDTRAFATCP